jgi:DNA repair photolyase
MPLAQIAAVAPVLEAKAKVEYRELPTQKWIGRCDSGRVPFGWSINPYRGCEYACRYCYARYTHEFMGLSVGDDFDRRIFAKRWSASQFASELRRVPRGETIGLGTATDPYQPAERRYGITRRILEVFAQESGRALEITTKSDLIRRDSDLLIEASRRNRISVNMTVTTLDEALARTVEPKAPRPSLRIDAMRELSRLGVRMNLAASPVLPGINDGYPSLDALARAAQEAGARSMWAGVVFLKPCSKEVFLPFLAERFPHLARRYREAFSSSAYLRGEYPETIRRRVDRIREAHGLAGRDDRSIPFASDPQLELFVA